MTEGEEPLGAFREVTASGKRAPKRSAHAGTVHKFAVGVDINEHWSEYIGKFPRSQGMKEKRRTPEDRRTDENTSRENNPILARTFSKDHQTSALNTKALACALHIGLERRMNEQEYRRLVEVKTFTHWSKMFAAYLRHMKIIHPDGSISIEELAAYMLFVRQLCHTYFDHPDVSGLFGKYTSDHILLPETFRPYGDLVPYNMPMALALVYNDKNRFQMAVTRSAEYRTTMLPEAHDYEACPSSRGDDNRYLSWEDFAEVRKQFKDNFLYSIEDIIMIHIRAASGQTSNPELRLGERLTREMARTNPKFCFLVHGTVYAAMSSIERQFATNCAAS